MDSDGHFRRNKTAPTLVRDRNIHCMCPFVHFCEYVPCVEEVRGHECPSVQFSMFPVKTKPGKTHADAAGNPVKLMQLLMETL